jgi:transcriptional regulator of acetoin/glycerol metabolism
VLDRLEQVAAFVGEQSVCDPVDAAVPDASPPGWARRTPRRKPRYVPPDDPDEERRNIRAAKARAGGNISEAARLLGITRQGLYSRMRRLCLGNGNPSKEMLS